MFIGRKEEISKLNEFFEDDEYKVACLFGLKGIGKTALLKKLAKDKKSVYFTAYPNTDFGQLVSFANVLGNKCKLPMESYLKDPDKLESQFDLVPALQDSLDLITEMAKKDPVLFVLENYHVFIKSDPTFEGILHEYITKEWKKLQIKVVFTDQSALSLEKDLLTRTCIYKDVKVKRFDLEPLTASETKKYLPNIPEEDFVFMYGITGGVPAKLERVLSCVDFEADYIKKQAFKALYFPEVGNAMVPDADMSYDLREMSYYNRILVALAYNNYRVNQLAALVCKPKDIVVPYMKTLSNLGVVTKENAITEKNNRKKTRYSIKNLSYLFWYRYIATNMNLFYEGNADALWKKITKDLDAFMKASFVCICKEYLKKRADAGQIDFTVEELGNWWENDEEAGTSKGFDFVAIGKTEGKHSTAFARCYYNDKEVQIATLKDVIEVAKLMPSEGENHFVIFSKSGFAQNAKTVATAVKNITIVTLEDVAKLV